MFGAASLYRLVQGSVPGGTTTAWKVERFCRAAGGTLVAIHLHREPESSFVRRLPCIAFLLFAALARAEEPARPRDVVRAALLDGATLPAPAEMPLATPADAAAGGHEAARKRIDLEREAHLRAAEHGNRQSREPHPSPRGDAAGGMTHGGADGMDGGTDCHDAASNMRTRSMHGGGGGMGPGHMGMDTAPPTGTAQPTNGVR